MTDTTYPIEFDTDAAREAEEAEAREWECPDDGPMSATVETVCCGNCSAEVEVTLILDGDGDPVRVEDGPHGWSFFIADGIVYPTCAHRACQ